MSSISSVTNLFTPLTQLSQPLPATGTTTAAATLGSDAITRQGGSSASTQSPQTLFQVPINTQEFLSTLLSLIELLTNYERQQFGGSQNPAPGGGSGGSGIPREGNSRTPSTGATASSATMSSGLATQSIGVSSVSGSTSLSGSSAAGKGSLPGGFQTVAQLKQWCYAHPDDLFLPGGYQGPILKPNTTQGNWISNPTYDNSAPGNRGDNAFSTDPSNPGGTYGILKGIPYGTQIEDASLAHNANPVAIAKIAFIESRDNPNQGQGGLFQVEDQWWRPPGYNANTWSDPLTNANAAVEMLGTDMSSEPGAGNGNSDKAISVWNVGFGAPIGGKQVIYHGKQMDYVDEFHAVDSQELAALAKAGDMAL